MAATLLLLLAALTATSAAPARQFPQYLVLNKANFVDDKWAWDQNDPASASQASVDALLGALNCSGGGGSTPCRGGDKRRLALSHITLLTGVNATAAMEFLDNVLALSLANDLPVSVELDVFQWWNGRPDLWNWWNASAPGYDPANAANVEWTGWTAADATMLSWRNWGSQFRTPAPHPNLGSLPVLGAYVAAARPFLARVSAWYAALPPGQRYLLAGVKLSEEVNVGPNFYFYPGGNALVGRPPHEDPTGGAQMAAQQGYAAVCTTGAACAGALTSAQLDAVVTGFYAALGGAALAAGLPRARLYAHTGADFGDANASLVWNSGASAVTPYAAPAWSVYRDAADPAAAGPGGLDAALDAVAGGPWALGEWYLMDGGANASAWADALAHSLGYRNARALHVFNWESLQRSPAGLAGVVAALAPGAAPPCLVEPPAGLVMALSGGGTNVTVTWAAGPLDADAAALTVSTLPLFLPSGALAVPDVVAGAAVGAAPGGGGGGGGAYTFALPPGYAPGGGGAPTLYASIVAAGCAPPGTRQRQAMASEVAVLPLGGAAGAGARASRAA